ncbi:hypothetical protein B0H17DRAFT_1144723 [Mycena rosella]|uniref:Uncharacterized protein n=1 Tax=Mycena rosella TaxID=1033263 RepID=A0AAD7G6E6_MYCRO|nr:hypothetical protein B0H17DRAFT_1144723 [Mycena rosella]
MGMLFASSIDSWDRHRAAFAFRSVATRRPDSVHACSKCSTARITFVLSTIAQTRLDLTNERERRVASLVRWTHGGARAKQTLLGLRPDSTDSYLQLAPRRRAPNSDSRNADGASAVPLRTPPSPFPSPFPKHVLPMLQIRPLSRYESRATTRGERSMDAAILIRAWAENGRRHAAALSLTRYIGIGGCGGASCGPARAWYSAVPAVPERGGGGLEASADSARAGGYCGGKRRGGAGRVGTFIVRGARLAGLAGLAQPALYARAVWDQYRAKANRSSCAHLASSLGGLRCTYGTCACVALSAGFDGQRIGPRALAARTQLPRMRRSIRVCGMRARMREILGNDSTKGPDRGGVAFESISAQTWAHK